MNRQLKSFTKEVFLFLNTQKPTVENEEELHFKKYICKICTYDKLCKCYDEILSNNEGLCETCERITYNGNNKRIKSFIEMANPLSEEHNACPYCEENIIDCVCLDFMSDDMCSCNRFLLNNEKEAHHKLRKAYGYYNKNILDKKIYYEEEDNDEDEDIDDRSRCIVCLISRINTVLLTCKHAMFCDRCINSLVEEKCPYCRIVFKHDDVSRIYLP